jgi:hypothetical protein
MMSNETKVKSLKIYAEGLQARLKQAVPKKREWQAAAFKQMLEIDLKKTLNKIEELSK